MKLLLLTLACLAAALAAPSERKQRDILPGDPRYGTDYHHKHHQHHHHEGEGVQVFKSVGSYVGSYKVPETSGHGVESRQTSENSFGLPTQKPDYLPPTVEPVKKPLAAYGDPQHLNEVQDNYIAPTVEDVKIAAQAPATSYGTPVTSVKTVHTLTKDYAAPTVDAPVTSYGTPIVANVKAHEHVQVPVTSIGSTLLKTNVETNHDDEHAHVHVGKTADVHHTHVEETKILHKPEIKAISPVVNAKETVHHGLTGQTTIGSFGGLSSGLFDSSLTSGSFGTEALGSTGTFGAAALGSNGGFGSFSSLANGFDTSSSVLNAYPGVTGFDSHSGFSSYPTYGAGFGSLGTVGHTLRTPSEHYLHGVHSVPPFKVSVDEKGNPFSDFLESINIPNFQFPQIPDVPFQIPSFGDIFKPQVPQETPVTSVGHESGVHVSHDAVTVENPVIKTPIVSKSVVSLPASTKLFKETVQPIAANGGYIY